MPAETWGSEYRRQNSATMHPFEPGATLASDDGLYLTPGVITDASVAIIGGPPTVGLTEIETTATDATVWFGDEDFPHAAGATFRVDDPPTRAALSDQLGRPAGLILLDRVAAVALQAWPAGSHSFPAGAAGLVASAVVPTPEEGLRGLVVGGRLYTGNIELVGDNGVAVRHVGGAVRIDVYGNPLFKRAACLDAGAFVTPSFLRTINGLGPDAYGGFLLAAAGPTRGGTILRVDCTGSDTIEVSLAGPAGG